MDGSWGEERVGQVRQPREWRLILPRARSYEFIGGGRRAWVESLPCIIEFCMVWWPMPCCIIDHASFRRQEIRICVHVQKWRAWSSSPSAEKRSYWGAVLQLFVLVANASWDGTRMTPDWWLGHGQSGNAGERGSSVDEPSEVVDEFLEDGDESRSKRLDERVRGGSWRRAERKCMRCVLVSG